MGTGDRWTGLGRITRALGGVSAIALATVALSAPAVAQDSRQATDPTGTPVAPTGQQGSEPDTQAATPQVRKGAPSTASGQEATAGAASGTQEGGDVSTSADGDDIVVTGLRQSLASAQAIKQNSEQFVDSITAQDIGRLPDTNIAEALQRISGIQITRNLGEGSGIAIRGLTQVRTELNGRDIFSANGSRGLSFEEVGPDLLAGVDVYKNPSAELIEGSLGGTVNLRTRLPFDAPGRVVSVTSSYTRYDLIDDDGASVSGLVSDRWSTGLGEFGLLVNVSAARTAFREDDVTIEPYHYHGPGAALADGTPVENTPVPGYATQNIQVPHGGGFSNTFGTRKRFSAAAALQWRPADNFLVTAQYLTARYKFADRGLSFFAYGDPITPTAGSTYTVENGIATSGKLANPNVDSVTYGTSRDTETSDYSINAKWDLTDRLHFSVDYQHIYSAADQQTLNLTVSALNPTFSLPTAGQNWNLFFDTRGKIPTLTSDLPGYFTRLANYGLTAILPYAEDNTAKSDAVRADLEWDFDDGSFLRKVSVGGRYSDKSAINRNTTYGTWTAIGTTCQSWSNDAGCYLLSEAPQLAEFNPLQSDLLRGRAADTVFGPVYEWKLSDAVNAPQAFADLKAATGQVVAFRPFDDPGAFNGTIGEKDYSAYARVGLGSTIFGMDWDGNLGLRWIKTSEAGNGFQVLSYRTPGATPVTNPDGTVTAPPSITVRSVYTGGLSYEKWLPSVNLRLHVTPKLQGRFAYSRNIYRPDFTQLNPSFNLSPSYSGQTSTPTTVNASAPYNATSNPYAGTGSVAGNPNLRPQRVQSFDASLEWYFSSVGYLYGTVFQKSLRDIIDNRTYSTVQAIPNLGNVQFNVTSVVNVSEGSVKGFEVGGQRFLDFLPGALSGIGVQANYTLADSDAGVSAQGSIGSTNTIRVPLIGLSKHSYNLIALYDKYGINLRLAYNWRGKYLVTTSGTGTQTLAIFSRPYGVLDASASYDISKNISVTIDAQNINDAAYRTYQTSEQYPRDYRLNDRRVTGRIRVRL